MASHVSTLLTRLLALLCLAVLPLTVACKGDDDGDEHGHDEDAAHDEDAEVGVPSGATCPDDAGVLTYEDFGKPFVEAYCTRCHSSELEGAARNNAPPGHDFDSLAGILLVGEHIDQMAAFGPDSMNDDMPPSGLKPTNEEREKLGQWLACEEAN
jgi:uncharacterized membrane protein